MVQRQSGSTRATGYWPDFSTVKNSGMHLKAYGTAAMQNSGSNDYGRIVFFLQYPVIALDYSTKIIYFQNDAILHNLPGVIFKNMISCYI